jgi:UDP-N-acetylglucosamine:LPS N-acetylglucosamine transferase
MAASWLGWRDVSFADPVAAKAPEAGVRNAVHNVRHSVRQVLVTIGRAAGIQPAEECRGDQPPGTGTARGQRRPRLRSARGDRQIRVVILSAGIGAGHDGAARQLAHRLRERGIRVDLCDVLEVFPGRSGRLICDTYHGMLRVAPWTYGVLFGLACRIPGVAAVTRTLLRPARWRLLRLLPPDTRTVVATHPLASQLLGPLRDSGHLAVPAITYLTDFEVNPIWIAPGIDVHCAVHEASRERASVLGAADVRVAGRVVSAGCQPATAACKRQAREQFGLPPEGRLALLVAGSWGVGEVADAANDIAATAAAVPVVVCAHNAELYHRLHRQGFRHVLGWVDDMPALMHAVDVLVENAGGLTALEGMACGLPVVTYRAIPGHGKANAAMMAEAEVATWVRHRRALPAALVDALDGDRGQRQRDAALALFELDPATVVADVAKRVEPRPSAGQAG